MHHADLSHRTGKATLVLVFFRCQEHHILRPMNYHYSSLSIFLVGSHIFQVLN